MRWPEQFLARFGPYERSVIQRLVMRETERGDAMEFVDPVTGRAVVTLWQNEIVSSELDLGELFAERYPIHARAIDLLMELQA